MEYIKFPTTVKMLHEEIVLACDDYFARKIGEAELKVLIYHWADNVGELLFDGPGQYNPTVVQRIGKKRLKLVELMLAGYQTKLV